MSDDRIIKVSSVWKVKTKMTTVKGLGYMFFLFYVEGILVPRPCTATSVCTLHHFCCSAFVLKDFLFETSLRTKETFQTFI